VLIANSIDRSILKLSANITVMSSGDLTPKFGLKQSDEIGMLGKSLDNFLDNLNASLFAIRTAATRNTTAPAFDEISAHIHGVSDSVTEIYGNVSEMQSGSR